MEALYTKQRLTKDQWEKQKAKSRIRSAKARERARSERKADAFFQAKQFASQTKS